MNTRNPSPPPNAEPNGELSDQIGESIYSKRWLSSLILQILSTVSNSEEIPPEFADEIDQSLEEKLCCLWDITTDKTLISHLREFQLIPVFIECIFRSRCPRLTEISLGILTNLSLEDFECGLISEESGFISHTLTLLATDDTRILVELFRLLRSVLASRQHRQSWLDAIHFAPELFDQIIFILSSSMNAHLLMNTISAVETILRIDDSISELWCNDKLLTSLQEAQSQMSWLYGDEVEIVYRLLYIFSTNSSGVRTLMSRYYNLYPNFGVFLRKICEDEPHLIPFEKYNTSLGLVLPVIDVIVTNLSADKALTAFSCDVDILPCIFKIAWGCVSRNFVSGELALDDIWKDLSTLIGDLICRVHDCIQESNGSFSPEQETLSWLFDLENGDSDMRVAFVRCCLGVRHIQEISSPEREGRGAVEVARGHLVFVCQHYGLPRLLECATTDHH